MYTECLYSTACHKYAYIGTERRAAAQSSCQRKAVMQSVGMFIALPLRAPNTIRAHVCSTQVS